MMFPDKPTLRVVLTNTIQYANGTHDAKSNLHLDYLELMRKYMNISLEIVPNIDTNWGTLLPNGSFNGMIGMINRSEVDFGIGPFSLDPHRNTAIRYSFPLHFSYNVLLTPRPVIKSDMAGLLKAFPTELWLLILASLMVIPIALIFTEIMEGKIFKFKTTGLPGKAFMWAVKAITQEGSDWLPDMDAGRIIVAVWLLGGLVIVSAYSGILIALLTLPKVNTPIDSIEDLVKQNEIPWVLMRHTSFSKYLQKAEDPNYREAFERALRFIKYCEIYYTTEEGLAQFCTDTNARIFLAKDFKNVGYCRLYIAKEQVSPDVIAMAFRRDSQYLEATNKLLMRIVEGAIDKTLFDQSDTCLHSPTKDKPPGIYALTIKSFGGPFILLGIGFLLSTLVFFCELARKYFHNRAKNESTKDY